MTDDRAEAHCTEIVRVHDRDHWLTTMLAPAEARPRLHALYAFNQEIARVRETVSEPMMGRIRLQCWRETVDGAISGPVREHPVAEALVPLIGSGRIASDSLIALIDAREADLDAENFPTRKAFLTYCGETGGALEALAVGLLGADQDGPAGKAARHAGRAWALTGQLRSAAWRASQGRVDLPRDLLNTHGVGPESMMAGRPPQGLREVAREIADAAQEDLAAARTLGPGLPKSALPVLMLTRITEACLKRIARNGHELFAGRTEPVPITALLNLYAGAMTGRY